MFGTQPNGGLYEDDEPSDDDEDFFDANIDMVNIIHAFNSIQKKLVSNNC